MRSTILVLGLMMLLACPASAAGQSRRDSSWRLPWHDSQANRRGDNARRSRLETRFHRRRPDVYGSSRALSLSTRLDNLRNELERKYSDRRRGRKRGLVSLERPLANRAARMLDRRNLLQSRSILGRSRSALLGRQDYVLEAGGHWRGEVSLGESAVRPVNLLSTAATTKPQSYSSQLSKQLDEKAHRYYKLGIASFREGKYPQSRDYFQLVRQLESDDSRAFVAIVLVSLQGSDLHTAITSLIRGIHRAESLSDLSIEWKEFYAKEQDFQRVVDTINLMAKSGAGTNKTLNLLLAYYSFLNGDLNTAIAEAKRAEEQSAISAARREGSNMSSGDLQEDPFTTAAKRFGELLVAARDQDEALDDGG